MSTIDDFLKLEGLSYTVKRDSAPSRVELGLADEEGSCISFIPGTDIIPGDTLISPDGSTVCVIKTQVQYFNKKPYSLNAYYADDSRSQADVQAPPAVYNIQNAYGSIIGNSSQATINYNSAISDLKEQVAADTSADKEQMEKIVSLLEMITNNQVPPTQGILSKFSGVMERNSWFSSSAAGAILSWLMTKIP